MMQKNRETDLPEDLLKALHLLTRDGKLNADAARKLKQIEHLLQFFETAVESLKNESAVSIVDLGSGKSYLGFLFYERFLKFLKKSTLTSIELRPELSLASKELAHKLNFERMNFFCGSIEQASDSLTSNTHFVTALHACDTATDDAILFGLKKNAKFIGLVPCCQAEVARSLESVDKKSELGLLFRQPLHRREFGSHLTNVLRALVLESYGYKVRVTEFVGWEHSHKNELIFAEKHQQQNRQAAGQLKSLLRFFPVKMKLLESLSIG